MDGLPIRLGGVRLVNINIKIALEEIEVERRERVSKKDLLRHQPHRTEKEMDKKVMGPTPKVTMGPTQKKGKDPEKAKRQLRQNQLRRKRMDKLKSLIQVRPKTS